MRRSYVASWSILHSSCIRIGWLTSGVLDLFMLTWHTLRVETCKFDEAVLFISVYNCYTQLARHAQKQLNSAKYLGLVRSISIAPSRRQAGTLFRASLDPIARRPRGPTSSGSETSAVCVGGSRPAQLATSDHMDVQVVHGLASCATSNDSLSRQVRQCVLP